MEEWNRHICGLFSFSMCKRCTQGNVSIVYLFLYNEAVCNKEQKGQNESVVATILVIQAMLQKYI